MSVVSILSTLQRLEPEAKKVVAALDLLRTFDFKGAVRALEKHDAAGNLKTVEDVMKVIGIFVPQVAEAERVLEIIGPLFVYAAVYGRPVQPGDPAYELPAGNGNISIG